MTEKKEYILCSAIWYDDGETYPNQPKHIAKGFVICGRRHHNCITSISIIKDEQHKAKLVGRDAQGFLTNTNRFVNRAEAYEIARDAGQLLLGDYQTKPYMLTSEDLY